jgi:hypothetical protein
MPPAATVPVSKPASQSALNNGHYTYEHLRAAHTQALNATAVIIISDFFQLNNDIMESTLINPDGTGHHNREVYDWATQGGDIAPLKVDAVKAALAQAARLPPSQPTADLHFTLLLSWKIGDKLETREYDLRSPPKELRQLFDTLGTPWFIPASAPPASAPTPPAK